MTACFPSASETQISGLRGTQSSHKAERLEAASAPMNSALNTGHAHTEFSRHSLVS
jgi:hypothetical protein